MNPSAAASHPQTSSLGVLQAREELAAEGTTPWSSDHFGSALVRNCSLGVGWKWAGHGTLYPSVCGRILRRDE